MRSSLDLQKILGITRSNYETIGWGTTNQTFQIQASIADNFSDLMNTFGDVVSNREDTAFNEIAMKAYSYLEFVIPVISRFPKLAWFTDEGKLEQRVAVFKIMQFWSDNNMIKEVTNGGTISTNNFSIVMDTNDTITIGERIGMDAWTFIQKTGLWRTKLFDTEEDYITFVQDTHGNYEIIGKFDTDAYPVLT